MRLTVSPGTLVADRFTVIRFIAEGGMGEVYEARDEILGEPVALKFLSHRNIGDEQVTRRFRREIQLARKVTHPNVCRLFDVFQHALSVPGDGNTVKVTFVTMELLRGETLEDRLVREGKFSEDQALPIVVQMCDALAAAHNAGIIHRDFKSNNVMIEALEEPSTALPGGAMLTGQRVVITDFGLARSMMPSDPSRTPLTADQLILGTADYMSPEQISGDPVSPASDIYALGVVMFEMVTGHKPYSAANPMQLLVQRVSQPPARPREFVASLSSVWESVIMRCLSEDPQKRPASAIDVIRELEVTEVIDLPKSPQPLPAPAPEKSRISRAGIAVGLLIAALLGTAFWASQQQHRAPKVWSPARVTTAPGLEMDPSFSPNGKQMVYSGESNSGRFELFIQELDATQIPRRLNPYDGQAFEPAWSPDGARIAYHSRQNGGIWSIAPEGGAPERLTASGSRPTWSADGKQLAFQSLSSPLVSDTVSPAMAPSVISVLDMETREIRAVTRPGEPAGGHGAPVFTPDGRHLIFSTSGRSKSEIWALRLQDGGLVPILRQPTNAYDPAISLDGKRIFYVVRDREVKALWQIEVDPTSLETISQPREIAGVGVSSLRQPTVSRDGTRLLFAAYQTRSNLYSLALDEQGKAAGVAHQLTFGDDRNNRPVFSPDGRQVAFDHWKIGIDIDIWTMDLGTGQNRQITQADMTNSHASWWPDGQSLMFTSELPDRRIVKRIDPELGQPETLTELGTETDWTVLSPDGTHLAYHSTAGGRSLDLWLKNLASGKERQITHYQQLAGFPNWSPDGKSLSYQAWEGDSNQVWIVDIESGDSRQLTDLPGHSWPFSFSPDSQRVAFAGQRDGVWNLYWVAVDSGEIHQLTDNRSVTGYLRYPSWSPIGDRLVYEGSTTTSDLFVVDNFL